MTCVNPDCERGEVPAGERGHVLCPDCSLLRGTTGWLLEVAGELERRARGVSPAKRQPLEDLRTRVLDTAEQLLGGDA